MKVIETGQRGAPDSVTMKFTRAEAELLMRICYMVGGDPIGPRGFFDVMLNKLRAEGFSAPPVGDCSGSIHLPKDWPRPPVSPNDWPLSR